MSSSLYGFSYSRPKKWDISSSQLLSIFCSGRNHQKTVAYDCQGALHNFKMDITKYRCLLALTMQTIRLYVYIYIIYTYINIPSSKCIYYTIVENKLPHPLWTAGSSCLKRNGRRCLHPVAGRLRVFQGKHLGSRSSWAAGVHLGRQWKEMQN